MGSKATTPHSLRRRARSTAHRCAGRPTLRRLAAVMVAMLVMAPVVVIGEAGSRGAGALEADGVDWSNIDPGALAVVGPADPAMEVLMYLNMAPEPDLVTVALAVSSPLSPLYGDHLDLAEAVGVFGASAEHRQAVVDAVEGVGGSVEFGPTNTFARVVVTIAQASELFSVAFDTYEVQLVSDVSAVCAMAGVGGRCVAPAAGQQPTLPDELVGIVDAAFGLIIALPPVEPAIVAGPVVPAGAVRPAGEAVAAGAAAQSGQTPATPVRTGVAEGCTDGLNAPALQAPDNQLVGLAPNQLATAYGYDQLAAAGLTGDGVRLAVLEQGGNVVPSDLVTFAECFGFDPPTLRQVNVPGGQAPAANPGWVEATLDAQVIAQIAPGLEAFDLYSYNGISLGGVTWLLEMLSMPLDPEVYGDAPADIVSVSYGECEPLFVDEASGLLAMTEQLLALAATTPMTFVVASGDNGSSGCQRLGIPDLVASQYPATSPWVLSVGGTSLTLNGDNTIAAEAVWNDSLFAEPFSQDPGGGGGGVSGFADRPVWQTGPGVALGAKRQVPDVASFADSNPGWIIYCSGACGIGVGADGYLSVGGTSAATPQVAGILALVTEAGRNQGQPAVGFVNPLIYELARAGSDALRDVTVVSNDVNAVGCCEATEGFDTASGWGSVNAAGLLAALANPIAALSATGPVPGSSTVTLDASGSVAPVGSIVEYAWDTTGDEQIDTVTTQPTLTVDVARSNPWTFSVTVRGITGRVATAAVTVTEPAPGPVPGPGPKPAPVVPRFTG